MSQQGGSPTGREDDWWGELYDDAGDDTGGTGGSDSLDDRFASATGPLDADRPGRRPPAVPGPRAAERGGAVPRAPWEPPPAGPRGPVTFPDGSPGAGIRGRSGTPGGTGGAPPPQATAPPPPQATAPPPPQATAPPPPQATAPPPPPAVSPPPPPPPPPLPLPANWPPARPTDPPPAPPAAPRTPADAAARPRPARRDFVGSGPPTYDPEPTALPPADPDALGDLVADTVLDGARYGSCTLRALSLRGDSARYRGDPRRDALLTARFGAGDDALVLVAMATGGRAATGAHRAAAELCRWIGRAVGRSHLRLAEDLRAARRGDLKSGLHRLTDRSLGRLRASATEQGLTPEEYTAGLRCLLLPADPDCRTRVFFGVGAGGLFRLRDGWWQDIEPRPADTTGAPVVGFGSPPAGAPAGTADGTPTGTAPGPPTGTPAGPPTAPPARTLAETPAETPDGDRLTMDLGVTTPPGPYQEPALGPPRRPFRFRASVARPGDVLLLCTAGLADPLRGEAALRDHLAGRWSGAAPPGLAGFLADVRTRVKGYADDRTAAAVWEA
ncbi:protein phosphatase 2C domain-containing protein [Streptomyces sp. JW3]|uniref:protein phosphatase 2C domain-containing protein n=1 Tax=Streptomyces sp. JW3 TaxID=3456955 RepID=UPI003FA4A9F0